MRRQRLAGQSFNGGTTIAATMILAELAGISVFATGKNIVCLQRRTAA